MIERSLVLWRIPATQAPVKGGDVAALSIDFNPKPELLEHLGADRKVTSHTVTPLPGGDLLFSLFLERT